MYVYQVFYICNFYHNLMLIYISWYYVWYTLYKCLILHKTFFLQLLTGGCVIHWNSLSRGSLVGGSHELCSWIVNLPQGRPQVLHRQQTRRNAADWGELMGRNLWVWLPKKQQCIILITSVLVLQIFLSRVSLATTRKKAKVYCCHKCFK